MPVKTYGRWPWSAVTTMGPAWALVAGSGRKLRDEGAWVAGLSLPILLTHQSEEWVLPGGFLPFWNEDLLGSKCPDWPLTQRDGLRLTRSSAPGTSHARGACRCVAAWSLGAWASLSLACYHEPLPPDRAPAPPVGPIKLISYAIQASPWRPWPQIAILIVLILAAFVALATG